ncbi:MAG TPA: hypothetical protein DIU07_01405 [Rhodobacteraceae bacterium]|nr:hypothetical protein [Paracoccaceae bacterium]
MPETDSQTDKPGLAQSAEATAWRTVLLAGRGALLLPLGMIAEAVREGVNALKGFGYLIGIGLPEKPDDLPEDFDDNA